MRQPTTRAGRLSLSWYFALAVAATFAGGVFVARSVGWAIACFVAAAVFGVVGWRDSNR